MAKKETTQILERTYTVPLRKEYLKAPRWVRTKKAVKALREFLMKHMKSEDVKLSKELNEKLWQHGIKNPPHHVKVTVTKDEKGIVKAQLFGVEEKKEKTTKPKKTTEQKVQTKKEENTEAKETNKEKSPAEKEMKTAVKESASEEKVSIKKEAKPEASKEKAPKREKKQ